MECKQSFGGSGELFRCDLFAISEGGGNLVCRSWLALRLSWLGRSSSITVDCGSTSWNLRQKQAGDYHGASMYIKKEV